MTERNYEQFEEEIVEETPRKTKRILKSFLIVPAVTALFIAGMTTGIFLTRSGFKDDQLRLETLQEEVTSLEEELTIVNSSSEEELEEALARAEEAEAKVEDLQATNDSLEKRIEGLKEMDEPVETSTAEEGTQEYISWKFWSDGNLYQAVGDNIFYSDPGFEEGLENSKILLISPVVSTDKIKNETGDIITIYTSLSKDGFVYSREIPYLEPVE